MEKVLTIAVPTYNVEKYLTRCLDSILYDELSNEKLEVIIVNDGSTDNSLEIARNFQKKYPNSIVVVNKENGGHGSTINVALKLATGKYFKVIDSDDWVNIDEFSNFVNLLEKIDTDLVLTNYSRELVYNGEQIKFEYSKELKYNKIYDLNKFDFKILGLDYFFMATSTIKTKVLKESNLHLDEKTFYVDMEYDVYPINYINNFIYLDYDIYRYFIGRLDQSININGYINHRHDHEKVLKKLLQFYKEMDENNKKNYVENIILQMLNSHYIIYCKTNVNKKLVKDMRREILKFDNYIKEKYNNLYNKFCNINSYVLFHSKTKFYFAMKFNNLFTRVITRFFTRMGS